MTNFLEFNSLSFSAHPVDSFGALGVRASKTYANGYGVSVVRGPASYGGSKGLYELGILKNGKLTYSVTLKNRAGDAQLVDDVLGFLAPADVDHYMQQIKGL